jgi:hypothetical protein
LFFFLPNCINYLFGFLWCCLFRPTSGASTRRMVIKLIWLDTSLSSKQSDWLEMSTVRELTNERL